MRKNGPRVAKKCRGRKWEPRETAQKKNKGRESRKQERKLRGIREQQEARDTIMAWLKKGEKNGGGRRVPWHGMGNEGWSRYREDQRW